MCREEEYRGARIQVLDLPGIIKGASSGKGLGKRILSVARTADLVLLILDVFQPHHEDVLINELGNIGIRLNQLPPNITIEKASMGGIAVAQQVKLTKITEGHLKDILHLYGVVSARVVTREDVTSEQLADHMAGNVSYSKAITVLNKIDLVDSEFLQDLRQRRSGESRTQAVEVSANAEVNIDALKQQIYEKLRFHQDIHAPEGRAHGLRRAAYRKGGGQRRGRLQQDSPQDAQGIQVRDDLGKECQVRRPEGRDSGTYCRTKTC